MCISFGNQSWLAGKSTLNGNFQLGTFPSIDGGFSFKPCLITGNISYAYVYHTSKKPTSTYLPLFFLGDTPKDYTPSLQQAANAFPHIYIHIHIKCTYIYNMHIIMFIHVICIYNIYIYIIIHIVYIYIFTCISTVCGNISMK